MCGGCSAFDLNIAGQEPNEGWGRTNMRVNGERCRGVLCASLRIAQSWCSVPPELSRFQWHCAVALQHPRQKPHNHVEQVVRGTAAGFRAPGEDYHRSDAGDHHGSHRDGEHAGGDRCVRGEEAETAFKLPAGVLSGGRPVSCHSCDAVCHRDRPHRGQVAVWGGVLQHLHRHGCNVLHCFYHDPVCDQRGSVSL